jgi:O-antigen/teichoic acid export membrane protein
MKSVLKSSAWVFGSSAAARLVIALGMLITIRAMEPQEFADLTFATALIVGASQLLGAPLNHIYVLEAARSPEEWASHGLLLVQLGLATILCVLGSPLMVPFGALYPAGCLWLLAIVAFEFARARRQSSLQFWAYGALELLRAILFVAGLALLVALAPPRALDVVLLQAVVTGLIAAPLLWPILTNVRSPALAKHFHGFRRILSGDYRYLVAYFAVLAVFAQLDVLMLSALGDTAQLANYGAALRYYQVLLIAVGAVHAILLPSVQRPETLAGVAAVFRRTRWSIYLVLLLTLVSIAVAGFVIPLIDGARYSGSVAVFRILAVSAGVSAACSPYVFLLMRERAFLLLLKLVLTATAANALLGPMLILAAGASGAAVATLVSTALITVPIFIRGRRLLRQPELRAT